MVEYKYYSIENLITGGVSFHFKYDAKLIDMNETILTNEINYPIADIIDSDLSHQECDFFKLHIKSISYPRKYYCLSNNNIYIDDTRKVIIKIPDDIGLNNLPLNIRLYLESLKPIDNNLYHVRMNIEDDAVLMHIDDFRKAAYKKIHDPTMQLKDLKSNKIFSIDIYNFPNIWKFVFKFLRVESSGMFYSYSKTSRDIINETARRNPTNEDIDEFTRFLNMNQDALFMKYFQQEYSQFFIIDPIYEFSRS